MHVDGDPIAFHTSTMSELAEVRTTVGMDKDGDIFILQSDGSAASYRAASTKEGSGVWCPGIIWASRTILEFALQENPAVVARLLEEAAAALTLSRLT